MSKKTVSDVQPGKSFQINYSDTRYTVIYKEKLRVCCVITGGCSSTIGSTIFFPIDTKIVNETSPTVEILLRLNDGELFLIQDRIDLYRCILLRLIKRNKSKNWKCQQLAPKSDKIRELSITTPVIKVC